MHRTLFITFITSNVYLCFLLKSSALAASLHPGRKEWKNLNQWVNRSRGILFLFLLVVNGRSFKCLAAVLNPQTITFLLRHKVVCGLRLRELKKETNRYM
jgi:hypothetical protein